MRLTLIAVAVAATLAGRDARAQAAATDSGPTFPFPLPALVPLTAPNNPAVRPGGRYGPATTPRAVAGAWLAALQRAMPDPRALRPDQWTLQAIAATARIGPPTFAAAGGIGAYASIGLQLSVRFEVKADQFRNLACTPFDLQNPVSGCTSKFPTISPTPQYSILSSGVIGQRLHLNVDFNSQREFDANNTIQVWYEGLPDEVLRRVEAGNVTFSIPASRFITAAVPANNFGFQAVAQVGDLVMRGIYAQQKGTVVKDRIYTVGAVTNQSVARDGRDLDYEGGRFFFVVDPQRIPGYPAIDILNLAQGALPPDLQVSTLMVYRMRALAPGSSSNQNIGGVRAVACGPSATRPVDCTGTGAERAGPFQWQILQRGKDYYVDPTGTWFALASALDQNDYLAVSYVPVGGVDTVGTLPLTASADTARVDTLRLVYDPAPAVTVRTPSFRFEIRSAYRFGSGTLTRETAQLSLTVNQRQRPALSGQTYLQLLGLALPSNPNQFDQYNRLFPRTRDPQAGAPLRDFYVIFPSLIPFADSTRLAPAERNDSLYRTPQPLFAVQPPPSIFALHYQAAAVASADRSTLSLNSFQIRDGSEKIYVGGNELTRGTDYNIDYATGTVQFLHPDSLFQNGVSQVRAQFEERTGFAIAPTSIYGLAGEYSLGSVGRVNATGLFQQQQSPFTRPPLGSEPASSFIGGISTELRFQPEWLSDGVGKLPGIHAEGPSFITLNGELAFSRPSPNSTGQASIEDFETQSTRFISLADVDWHWGSVPVSTRGAGPFGFTGTFDPGSFSGGFDPALAAFATWQSLPSNADGSLVQFLPQQIDPQILFTGATQQPEPVLWLTLKPDTVLGLAHNGPTDSLIGTPNWVRPPVTGPRWRSLTQTLSATGIDLTRTEYLEFWVWEDNRRTARANQTAVLFDFGSVFEDALAFVPDSFTVSPAGDTTYYGQHPVGLGKLDTERDPVTHSWSADVNDNGILSDRAIGIRNATTGKVVDTLPLCSASVNGVVRQFGFGDLRSRCGRHNGAVDTEDQDGDFQLDSVVGVRTHEDYVRFVFPIGSDKYFVRDGGMVPVPAAQGGGAAGWRLYRIPFRTDTLAEGAPNLRQVQALRITIVAPEAGPPGTPQPQVFFALSRVQLVGASWLKRADTPIPGIAGATGALGGQVVASFVSTENRDLGYTSPPGVTNQAANQNASLQLSSTQINEQSLRIQASGLHAGQHAEAFNRFTSEGDKNLLRYRELRVWARGRGPGWDDGDLEFYVKLGKDENNFYLYHTPARTASWEPEVVAEFQPWLILRAQIEQAWLRGDAPHVYPGCPDSTIVPNDSSYVMCDGPYIAHVHDPGTAPPNLAAVEEVAAGILRVRERTFISEAELWVDDIRVSNVVQDVGMAAALDLGVTASNLADLSLSLSHVDANFQQLGSDPSYSTDAGAIFAGTFHLERFMPPSWGIAMPLAVQYTTQSSAPFYVQGTDILADALPGLRTPSSVGRSVTLSVHRVRRASTFLGRYLLDPVAINLSVVNGDARTSLSTASATSFSYSVAYTVNPGVASVAFVPRFLADLLSHLPTFLRNAPILRDLAGGAARVRLNPTSVALTSVYSGAQSSQLSFPVAVREASDATLTPNLYYSRNWRNSGSLQLSPFTSLSLFLSGTTVRDLRNYGDSTSMGRLLLQQRRTLFGQDVGFEVQRSISATVSYTPNFGPGVRPRASLSDQFNLARDPNAIAPIRTADSAFRLPLAYGAAQRLDLGTQLDAGRLGAGMFGDSTLITGLLRHLTSVNLAYTRSRQSSFSQIAGSPTTDYQLGLGSLGSFRQQGGADALSALETATTSASAAADLLLGLRVSTTYQTTSGVTWILQGIAQVPQQVSSRDWPVGTASWSVTPSRGGLGLGRLLSGVTAQVTYRRHDASTAQSLGGGFGVGDASLTQATERTVSPGLTLSWIHGILSSADYTSDLVETITAGNLTRTRNTSTNAYVAFAFRPPASLVKLPTPVRANARITLTTSSTCIQAAAQVVCASYVDTRQRQTQFSMDTDFPPVFSAGLQVAYTLNQQLQLNQKTGDLTITAYVSFSTSVGQFR